MVATIKGTSASIGETEDAENTVSNNSDLINVENTQDDNITFTEIIEDTENKQDDFNDELSVYTLDTSGSNKINAESNHVSTEPPDTLGTETELDYISTEDNKLPLC